MKRYISPALALLAGLAFLFVTSGCDEQLTPPATPPRPSYTETKLLLDKAVSNGAQVSATFTLRDSITDGSLYLFCWLKPDSGLSLLTGINTEIGRKNSQIDSISARIFELWTQGTLTTADSLAMVNQANAWRAEIATLRIRVDSLDTWVDDRFKVSVWLDGDTEALYPLAVQVDSHSVGDNGRLGYLGDSTVVWGQGIYLALPDTASWSGKRMSLRLTEWWRSDPSWTHATKPARDRFLKEPATYPDRFTRYELLPVRDWLSRLTPNVPHTLHVRFGAAGTETKVSASLFVVYKNPA